MATQVVQLVQLAQKDVLLRQQLETQPNLVAQLQQVPVIVVRAASLALRTQLSAYSGVWY